jgi:hypothetical protein
MQQCDVRHGSLDTAENAAFRLSTMNTLTRPI